MERSIKVILYSSNYWQAIPTWNGWREKKKHQTELPLLEIEESDESDNVIELKNELSMLKKELAI